MAPSAGGDAATVRGGAGRARPPRLSLRVRMALWLALLLGAVEVPVVISVLLLHGRGATTAFDAVLVDQARSAALAIASDRERILTSELRLAGLALDAETCGTLGRVRVAIVTEDGVVVGGSDRPATEEASERAAAAGSTLEWLTIDGQRRRGVAVPLPASAWSVWLSSDLQRQRDRTRPVRAAVISSALLAVLVAGVGGWLLAGVALRPLEDLTSLARTMTPQSIGRGVPLADSSTEVARLRLELDRALRRLDRAFRAQERFASNVAHELKTPIATILTETQVLRHDWRAGGKRGGRDEAGAGGTDADRVDGFLESVEDEMRRLGRLVEGFLLLTRVQDGDTDLRRRRADPNEVVMSVVERVTDAATTAGVRLRTVLLEDEVEPIVGDPDLLATMLENIVRNAIRFSPPDGAVSIAASRDDRTLVLTVDDDGPGIPAELADRIFDRFVQAPDEQRRGRGHGLGLAIAQGIAEMHGGRIEVGDRSGSRSCGCRLIVRLPRSAAQRSGD